MWKNGVDNGVQRYRCKSCGRYSSGSEPKYSDADKDRAIKMYLNNCGIRKTALFMGCSPATVLNWIRKSAKELEPQLHTVDGDIIEMDEIFAQSDRRIATMLKKNDVM
jgi:transposase-like protein